MNRDAFVRRYGMLAFAILALLSVFLLLDTLSGYTFGRICISCSLALSTTCYLIRWHL